METLDDSDKIDVLERKELYEENQETNNICSAKLLTCANFGILDCMCCEKQKTNDSALDEFKIWNEKVEMINSSIANNECAASTSTNKSNEDITDYMLPIITHSFIEEVERTMKECEIKFFKMIKKETALKKARKVEESSTSVSPRENLNSEDEEIDVVNGSPVNTSCFETIPETDGEFIDIESVNVAVNELNTNISSNSDTNSETLNQNEEKYNHIASSNEVQIVDVVNLIDSPLPSTLVNSRKNSKPVKKRKKLVRTDSRSCVEDSIIEISDSPISPKIITDIIHIDDDSDYGPSPKKNRTLGSCPVCLENFETNSDVMSTICGHIFCAACIKTAIKTSKKCPKCRRHLTLKNIHPLFF